MALFGFIGKTFKSIGKGIAKAFTSPEGLVTAVGVAAGFAVGGPAGAFAVAEFASYSGLALGVVGTVTGSSSLLKLGSHIGTVGVVGLGTAAGAGGVQALRAGTPGFAAGAPPRTAGSLLLEGAKATASEGNALLTQKFNTFIGRSQGSFDVLGAPSAAPTQVAPGAAVPILDRAAFEAAPLPSPPLAQAGLPAPGSPGAINAPFSGLGVSGLGKTDTKGFLASLDPGTKAFLGVQAVSSFIGGIGAGITQGEGNRIQELLVRGNLQQAKKELDLANQRFVQNTQISPRSVPRRPDVSLVQQASRGGLA